MKVPRFAFAVLVLFLSATRGTALSYFDLDVHMAVISARRAAPPQVIGRTILFTHQATVPTRYVGIAFEHELFRTVHVFDRNGHGIFVFTLPAPTGLTEIRYRMVFDGLWTTDPKNPVAVRDRSGIPVSIFTPPSLPPEPLAGPKIIAPNTVKFILPAPPGRVVYLSGDFNGWDPFMYRLAEETPGVYTIRLRLPPGLYAYYYIVDGTRISDPTNPAAGSDREGNTASLVRVPR